MSRYYLSPLLLVLSFVCKGQGTVVPPTPAAASFTKFLNYPIAYNTGVPDISIPLYNIKAGKLDIPVTLRYHASGIKVNEQSSWAGLGWDITTEPMITRQINGMDDLNGGYISNVYIGAYDSSRSISSEGSGYLYWDELASGIADEQPDVFTYSLLSGGGKFMFQKTSTSTYTTVSIPYKPIRITYISTNKTFDITDMDGTEYLFDQIEQSTPNWSSSSTYTVSWKCSRIISPSRTDTAFLLYNTAVSQTAHYFAERVEVDDNSTGPSPNAPTVNNYGSNSNPYPVTYSASDIYDGGGPIGIFTRTQHYISGIGYVGFDMTEIGNITGDPQFITSQTNTIAINEIDFRGGNAKFYSTRSSVDGIRLDSIRVFDINNNMIRTIRFYLTYFYPERNPAYLESYDNRMRLDSVVILNAPQNLTYSFAYNYPTPVHPWTKESDPWGYINDVTETPTTGFSVPYATMTVADNSSPPGFPPGTTVLYPVYIGGTFKQPDEPGMKSFALTKIVLPTGGRTEFQYAANKYLDASNNLAIAGGLRVEKIRFFANTTDTASVFEKIYKYGPNENGAGEIRVIPNANDYSYSQNVGTASGNYHKTTFTNHTMEDLYYADGCPVNYTTVTEYQKDMGVLGGKTIYTFSSYPTSTAPNTDMANSTHFSGTDITITKIDISGGQLLTESNYAYLNGNYTWIHRKAFQYTKYLRPNPIQIGRIFRNKIYYTNPSYLNTGDFTYYLYPQDVGTMLLTNQQESSRDLSDTNTVLTQVSNFFYDNTAHLQVTRSQTTNSDGKILTSVISYPQDYASGTAFMDNLVSGNILNVPIEKTTYETIGAINTILSGQLTTYSSTLNGLPYKTYQVQTTAPIAQSGFKFSNRAIGQLPIGGTSTIFSRDAHYAEQTSVDSYDNRSNPLQITTLGNIYISYIWDYNKLFPIAEIKNALASDCAFTSFESDGTGNWVFSGSPSAAQGGLTGKMAYNLSSGAISASGLSSSNSYIVSWWAQSGGSVTVSGGTVSGNVSGKIIGAWTYHECRVTGTASVSITGSAYIDELRLYPASAQMVSLTYQPSIGITSMCNAASQVTFYSYDGLGRLIFTKDQDGNIIKTYDYHNKGH